MSLFVFSAFIGLLLHQIVTMIQPIDGGKKCIFGQRIVIELPEKTYIFLKTVALVFSILLFVAVTIVLIAQSVHPPMGYAFRFADALLSPRMGAAIFGGLVGILVGNLLNRLLKHPDNYKFKASDYLEIALIAVLVILGIGGEEILRSYAQRINKISVGATTEISFSDAAPKATRASAEQPRGAYRNTQGDSGGSAGLEKLYDIGSKEKSHISRDKDFIGTLARYEGQDTPTVLGPGTLADKALSPIGSCLSGIFRYNGDATFIEEQLTLMSGPLRELAAANVVDTPKIRSDLANVLKTVAAYTAPALKKINDQGVRFSCADVATAGALDDASIDALRNSRETLPYAAMAYASVMAALHHYESAVFTMDGWINAAQERVDKKPTIADRWYVLRARLTLLLFLDEWIRQRGTAASSWLRKYHIDNVKRIVDGMLAFNAISAMSQKNADYKWDIGVLGVTHSGDDGHCDVPPMPKTKSSPEEPASDVARDHLQTLYDTYLSVIKDHVDHSLKHPIMKVTTGSIIESEIKGLMSQSLRCIVKDREIKRAEHIERYVRSELNLMETAASLKSNDELRNRIADAQQMLAFAFQLIDHEVTTARDGKDKAPIQDRISTELVLEVYETLLATQDQLKSFSEREGAQ